MRVLGTLLKEMTTFTIIHSMEVMKVQNEALKVSIETVKVGEDIRFKGTDCAKALEYSSYRSAI